MQFVPDVALRVRNNIDRFFDKNLSDLIRGIRSNKENDAKYISTCIEEIKFELRQDSTFLKANAVEKLTYLQMLGYDISWAAFNVVEVMASPKFNDKRIGYLAASQTFSDDTDVLMLTTNLVRKDLLSANIYDVGTALGGLSCFMTVDLARDLINDIINLLSSSRTYTRKKAILLLYKIYLQYPESLKYTFPRLRERLEDQDPGVQSAAVNVICELARKNPKSYLPLEGVFFRLLNSSSNNWMLIKIIKLFGSLVPYDPKLGKNLIEPLTNLINNTSAMSLLYECINTVIAILISISSEGPGDYTPSIQLCVQKLGVLIDDSDQNLKYLGLLAMGKILQTHPKAVQAHKDIVLRCLDDKDESIRLRALDLLYGMVSKKNIMEIVRKLMEHIDQSEGSFYRDELLRRIVSICSHNNYQYIANFEWYISVLVELTKIEGSAHGTLIADQLQDATIRVQSIRHFSVSQMSLLIRNAHLLLAGNSSQRDNFCAVLLVAAWICGEYAEYVEDPFALIESMLKLKLSIIPGDLLSAYVMNSMKLYTHQLVKLEAEDDWDGVESLDNLLLSKLPEFQSFDHLESQERACNFVGILKIVEQKHFEREKVAHHLAILYEGELNPVAQRAQKKVPVPQGLDLDEWIFAPEFSSTESEKEEEDEELLLSEASSAIIERRKSSVQSSNNLATAVGYGYQDEPVNNKIINKKDEYLSKKKKTSEKSSLTESSAIQRENNPYYLQPSSSSSAKHQQASNAGGGFSESDSKFGLKHMMQNLKNPLDIPGIVGLERWSEREGATLDWKKTKKASNKAPKTDDATESERKPKPGKKKSTNKGKRSKKGNVEKLASELSSSESESFPGKIEMVVDVNRDDGELPEGALSSHDEETNEQDFIIEEIETVRAAASKRMGSSFAANNFNQRKDSDSTDKNKKKVKRVKKTLKTANASEIKMAEEGETEKPVIKLKKKKKVVSLEKQISASINIFD